MKKPEKKTKWKHEKTDVKRKGIWHVYTSKDYPQIEKIWIEWGCEAPEEETYYQKAGCPARFSKLSDLLSCTGCRDTTKDDSDAEG